MGASVGKWVSAFEAFGVLWIEFWVPGGAEYIFQVQDIWAFEPGKDSHILLCMLSSENPFPSGTCKKPQLTLTLASGLYLELSVISGNPGPALGEGEAVYGWPGNQT